MDSERWQRVSELFADCLELPLADRDEFLRSRVKESDDVLSEVRRLLEEHEYAGSFLRAPAAAFTTAKNDAAHVRVFEDGDLLGDRFRVICLLGSGGMGEVYEAFDTQLQDRVAVKTLHQTGAINQKMVEQFRMRFSDPGKSPTPMSRGSTICFRIALPAARFSSLRWNCSRDRRSHNGSQFADRLLPWLLFRWSASLAMRLRQPMRQELSTAT